MKKFLPLSAFAGLALAILSVAQAQTPEAPAADAAPTAEEVAEAEASEKRLKELGAVHEGKGIIGNHAEIDIPENFLFFPSKGAQTIMKEWGNLTSGSEEGLIINQEKGWSVLFEFDAIGYVKDEDKDSLDATKMLKQIHESEPAFNEARKEAGLPAQHVVGFSMPPKYNETTNNLEWAIRFKIEGDPDEGLNYNTKLLGREGVMTATLMVDPNDLDAVLPEYQKLLTGYRFTAGHTYAEYRSGDKLATYGLAGLVVGGAGLAAAKTGLLAKFFGIIAKGGKAVIIGVVAIGAAIWKLFGKLFGRREQTNFEQ